VPAVTLSSLNTIDCVETTTVEAPQQENIPITALPKLVWLGTALFVTNVVVGACLLLTPTPEGTDPFGKEVQSSESAASKMSPFTPTVDTAKRRVKLAAKAIPSEFVASPTEEEVSAYSNGSLDIPRSSPQANELDIPRTSRVNYEQLELRLRTENAVYRPSEPASSKGILNVSTGNYSYDMPRASERVRQTNQEAAPRVGMQKDKNFVVIN
jgi:hypothetical protein